MPRTECRPLLICLDVASTSPFKSSSFPPTPILDEHDLTMRSRDSACNGDLKGSATGALDGRWDAGSNGKPEDAKMMTDRERGNDPSAETPQKYVSTVPLEPPDLPPTPPMAAVEPTLQTPADDCNPTRSPAAPTDSTSRIMISSPSTDTTSHQTNTSILFPNQPRRMSSHSTVSIHLPGAPRRALIQVRDFAFDKADERFHGAGALVPRANHLAVLVRRLVGDDDEDSEEDWSGADDDDDDDEDGDAACGRLADGGTLCPGLYRAVCAFEAEGEVEMALAEDQIVRVVGRGGGGGWAVVVDESAGPRLALVPESYLEAVALD